MNKSYYIELVDYLNDQINKSLITDEKIIKIINDINDFNSKTKNQQYYIRNKDRFKKYYEENKEKIKEKSKEKYNLKKIELAEERYKKNNNGSLEGFEFVKRGRPHKNTNEEHLTIEDK